MLAFVLALAAGCGARTGLDVPSGARCGDGVIDRGEQCDDGDGNADLPPILLLQGPLVRRVMPVARPTDVVSFYDYVSQSAHTGFEELASSELFLFRDSATGVLGLITEHGIDADATGILQPVSDVRETIEGLPPGTTLVLSDDSEKELFLDGPSTARGIWHFNQNTDGGAFSTIPFPASWTIDVTPTFERGVTRFAYIDADGHRIELDLATRVRLQAFEHPARCRTDCTVPRCGDGRLDAGEVCDDGNTIDGDGCSADCRATK